MRPEDSSRGGTKATEESRGRGDWGGEAEEAARRLAGSSGAMSR